MLKKLTNPFTYIAGSKALLYGLLAIIASSLIGHFSNTHFTGILSIKMCPSLPLSYFMMQGFINWLILSGLLYLAAILLSKSSVRIIDIFGTLALSRAPYVLAALTGFSKSMQKFGLYLVWTYLKQGEPVEITSLEKGIAIFWLVFNLLMTIWYVALMFNAYKVSTNLKDAKLILSFIVVLILTIIITNWLTSLYITKF